MEAEPPKADPPKRKRRWYQFSLRSLMIGVLIVAIPCAWLGHKIEQKRREREAVEAIKQKAYAIVVYDYQLAHPGVANPEPFGAVWARRFLGDNFFSEVKIVAFRSRPEFDPTDADLKNLKLLVNLKELTVGGHKITDAGITNIADLAELETLGLDGAHITNASMTTVAKLKSLKRLTLMGTWIDDSGIACLKTMPQLKYLYLNCPKVSARGISELQKALPSCEFEH